MMNRIRNLAGIAAMLILLLPMSAAAQSQFTEEEINERFREAMEDVVKNINRRRYHRLARMIDADDMLERIYGLRLIDPRIKRAFGQEFESNLPDLLEAAVQSKIITFRDDEAPRATLLKVESRNERGRGTVRVELPNFHATWHEYDLLMDADGNVEIVDWLDFYLSQPFTQSVGEDLIAIQPVKPAVSKLISYSGPRASDVFQVGEVLKAARDGDIDRFFEIYDNMNERLQRERVVLLYGVYAAKLSRKRAGIRRALTELDKVYADDPLFALMLLDLYGPTRQYQKLYDALQGFEARLGVDDAVVKARLGAASLALGQLPEARASVDRARELDDDIELVWWTSLQVHVAAGDFEAAVGELEVLSDRFGREIRTKDLSRAREYRALVASEPYKRWDAARPQPPED